MRYADHADGFCEVHETDPAHPRRALVLHGGFWRDHYDLTLMDGLCEDLALWLAAEDLVGRAVGQAPVSDLEAAAPLSDGVVGELDADLAASPYHRLPLGRPQLVVHGTLDDCVPVQMSRDYAASAGMEVTYVEREGEGHFEHIDPRSAAWADVVAWL